MLSEEERAMSVFVGSSIRSVWVAAREEGAVNGAGTTLKEACCSTCCASGAAYDCDAGGA